MRNRLGLIAGCAAISLVLAACGEDDSDGGTSGLDGEPITVGVIGAFSGPFGATITHAETVVRAWASSVNESGGINGHPVELIVEDDASNPGNSVTAAQQMVTEDVDVIIDVTTLGSTWAELTSEAGIPVIGGDLSSPLFYTNPLFFPSGQTNDSITYATVSTAQQAGGTKLGHLYCAEAPTCQESVSQIEAAGEELGVPLVYSASISATAPNYTAQCVAAQQEGVDALFVGHSAAIVAKVAADCSQQGYEPIYIEQGTGYTAVVAEAPGARDNLWAPFPSTPFFAEDQPHVQEFRDAVEAESPGELEAETISQFSAQAWTAGLLIEAALEAADVPEGDAVSKDDVLAGLYALEDETLDGWTGPLNFEEGETHSVPCWYTVRLQDGVPGLVSDELTCRES